MNYKKKMDIKMDLIIDGKPNAYIYNKDDLIDTMAGKIYIITNELYDANVYVIQSAQDPKQKVIELSSVFLTPLELKYVL